MPAIFNFPLTAKNFTGYFLFEILLSGTSEDVMFRALVVTSMLFLWRNLFRVERHLNIFGTFYGYLMVKTKSIAGPILAHNLLNGVITIVSLVLFLIYG
jgi:membrane protease YdiL (CAAX protease family)